MYLIGFPEPKTLLSKCKECSRLNCLLICSNISCKQYSLTSLYVGMLVLLSTRPNNALLANVALFIKVAGNVRKSFFQG